MNVYRTIADETGQASTETLRIYATLASGGVTINVEKRDGSNSASDLITYTDIDALSKLPDATKNVRAVVERCVSRVEPKAPAE